jgi:tetratricopeptide (TPR) repeat protein
MDIAQAAATAITLVLPILTNAVVEEAGKLAVQKLWDAVQHGLAPNEDSKLLEEFTRFEKHPEDIRLRAKLEEQLAAKLAGDPAFRRKLALLVQEASGVITLSPSSPTPPPAALHQLPADLADFTGREGEVADLLEAAKQAPTAPAILAMTGIGGAGKSALAVHVAHLLEEQFPDIQLFIDLQGAGSSPVTTVNALADLLRALGVEEHTILQKDPEEMAKLYRSLLSGKRALILLDNAKDVAQISPLIPGSPNCVVLITGRNKSLQAVAGKTRGVELNMLTEQDALALLERLIGKDRLTKDLEAARQIVRLCGNLPLAVRIAGGWLSARSDYGLQEYASRLSNERERLKQLQSQDQDLDVRTSFMLSYQKMSRQEARLFRLLGLFPGESFASEIVIELARSRKNILSRPLERWSAAKTKTEEDQVNNLVVAQLLEAIGGGRYSFHDLIRLFARECLEKESPWIQRAARRKITRWYVGKSKEINAWLVPEKCAEKMPQSSEESRQNEVLKALTWFEIERPNLLAAVEWSYANKDWETTWLLAENLSNFYNIRCHWAEWERTHKLALEATRKKQNLRAKGVILNSLGNVFRLQGRWDQSIENFQEALRLHREFKDPVGESIALNQIANVYRLQGRWDEAINRFREALEINCRTQNRYGQSITLGGLGNVYRMEGRWEDALQAYGKSLQISVERGDLRGQCISLNNMALVYSRVGRLDEAERALDRSMLISTEKMKLPRGDCIANRTRGEVRMLQGRWDEALERLTCSLELARMQKDLRCICQALRDLAEWHTHEGNWEAASHCLEEAHSTLCGMRDGHGVGLALRIKGRLLMAQNRREEATKIWREALEKLHPCSPESKEVAIWLVEAEPQIPPAG